MKLQSVVVIGLMSGTSLDGLDLVCVKFDKETYGNFGILHTETVAYSEVWKQRLQEAITLSKEELEKLDTDYAVLLAELSNDFIKKNKIPSVDFISSHGHTVFHKPAQGITLQVGNGQVLAAQTKQKVVCDFRTQDVMLGGQGAPLVPIGDELLFAEYDSCLNLGGFANISFKKKEQRIAFDICPVNIVLNHYVNTLGLEYDDKGIIASEGALNDDLLDQLNALDFYKKEAPKSLGLEWVQSEIIPLIDSFALDVPAILRTFVEHVAMQIANSINDRKNVLVTGGGVFNCFLLDRIREHSSTEIVQPTPEIVNFKEALIFAFLGLLRSDNQVNCLQSVTGAKRDHSSGVIFYP
ncbi:MAG: anhydro-N-acetylmuramic acid kinase [Polaribacter sp.]|nr:anhydro-N-acetylmuramic acid kinase [Polaribacter sp.]